MRDKLTSMKRSKRDEEIKSDREDNEDALLNIDSDDERRQKQGKLRSGGAVTADLINDPFFAQAEGAEENETAEEKRLRHTKHLIKQLGEDQKDKDKVDFFANL